MSEADIERNAIVAWLEKAAVEWRNNGFLQEPFAFGLAAKAIRNGEHRLPQKDHP